MKKFFPFALVATLAAFISCTENDEPRNPLIGIWEHREFVDSLDVWYVETLDFKNDSVFEQYLTVRQTEEGANLGYRQYSEAKYSQDAERVSFRFFSEFMFRTVEDSDILFVPKNELGPVIVERIYSAFNFKLQSNLKEMDYQIICFAPFEDSPVCEEKSRFIKVN